MSKPLILLNNVDQDIRWVAETVARADISIIPVFDEGGFYGTLPMKNSKRINRRNATRKIR